MIWKIFFCHSIFELREIFSSLKKVKLFRNFYQSLVSCSNVKGINHPLRSLVKERRIQAKNCQTKVQVILGENELDENSDPVICAKHLKRLIHENYLPPEMVATDLNEFYVAHRGFTPKMGALGIRFTVQFNLFLGSINALASEQQKQKIVNRHKQGELGCFALTERGGGTLSGLVVETICTWSQKEQNFILNSPTKSSEKIWISQGMVSSMGVIIAQLVVRGECQGVHAFLVEMNTPGIIRTDMGRKLNFNSLDNALITFNKVRIPVDSLLNKFCSIEKDYYQSETSFKFLIIAQRLLTGRVAIPMAMIGTLDSTICSCKFFFSNRKVFISRKKQEFLGNLPIFQRKLYRIDSIYNTLEAFLSIVEKISPNTATNKEIDLIAAAKIHCVSFACRCNNELRFVVGGYALTNSFFARSDIYLCGKFAEGDSKVLQQKMVRDLLIFHNWFIIFIKLLFFSPLYIFKLLSWINILKISRDYDLFCLYWCFLGLSKQNMFFKWYEKCELVFECARKHGLFLIYNEVLDNYGSNEDLTEFLNSILEKDILLENC